MTLPTSPTIGFTLPQRGVFFGVTTVAEMLALAAKVDANPLFGSIWVGDSLGAKPRPDSLTLLGALASATQRIRLGVGCMASFPVRDPLVFAYQWATLDLISNGRMLLAACTGLVAGGASAREGAAFPGAALDRALRRVAQLADGWMTTRLVAGLARSNWSGIAAALERQGRDPASFPTMAYHNVNLNPDRQAALEESKRFLDAYYGPVFSPQMVEAWTAAGAPEQCVRHLDELLAEGPKSVTLRITSLRQT